ncbi:MAG: two-component regulator propeller domain-containing protein, partial [Bacteroidales bacterium]
MHISSRVFTLLFLSLFSSGLCQQKDILFEEVNLEENYSFGIVEDFYQDEDGFIWIGAKDGLFRYDGIYFKAYYFDRDDPYSISNSVVRKIYGDSRRNMWVATEYGLNRYIKEKDQFIRYLSDPEDTTSLSSNFVTEISEDKDGNLWMSTINKGLCMYDHEKNSFIRYTEESPGARKISGNNLRTVFIDSEGIIWLGTRDQGVIRFNLHEHKKKAFLPGSRNGKNLCGSDVRCIVEDKEGKIWFGTNNKGISRYDKSSGKFSYFVSDPADPNTLGSNNIRSFTLDSKQNLWICTDDGGLNFFDHEKNSFVQYRYDKTDPNSISSDAVRVLYEDDAGNYWIGNFNAPINYVNNHRKEFYTIRNNIYSNNSLNNNQVTSILVDSDNIVWIGTDGGGLNRYDPAVNSYRHFIHKAGDNSSIPNNKPLCMVEDDRNRIWIGLFDGGLSCFDKKTGKFSNYYPDGTKRTPIGIQIWDLMIDGNDLWIATDRGVDVLNFTTEIFTRIPYGNVRSLGTSTRGIWSLNKDSKGRILIGTINGLNIYDPISKTFTYYFPDLQDPGSISDRWILCIFEDSNNRIWIGTNGGGLNLWNEHENKFECFDIHDGLAGNVINGILEDTDGYLWLGTNNGLSKFNYDSSAITNYNVLDGLQGNRFNIGAVFKDREGRMYFGGNNGLTYFDPAKIKDNMYIPPVVFTGFEIFNKEVDIHDPDSPIRSNINGLEEIHLHFRHRIFTIDFAALNYTYPTENRYKYMLENFEKMWNDVSNQHSATYTNLMPGRYTFRVIASNNDNVWNTRGKSIDIVVHPPFYRTWWFIILAILSIFLLIAGIYQYRHRQMRLMNARLSRLVKERTRELEAHSVEIEKQNKKIAEQRDLATEQRDKIKKQNEELEIHRNNLTDLVRQQTEELKKAKEKAEEGDQLKTAFLENISQEIRTPLNAILGFINLLIEKIDDIKSRDYYLNIINESGKSMLRLVEDIIDFSHIQIGELKPVYGECNISKLIKELVSKNRGKIARERPGLNFLAELPAEEVTAITDERKLTQIFSKLIENSIKFTEEGHVRIGIHKLDEAY